MYKYSEVTGNCLGDKVNCRKTLITFILQQILGQLDIDFQLLAKLDILEVGSGDGWLKRTIKECYDFELPKLVCTDKDPQSDDILEISLDNLDKLDQIFDVIVGIDVISAVCFSDVKDIQNNFNHILKDNGFYIEFTVNYVNGLFIYEYLNNKQPDEFVGTLSFDIPSKLSKISKGLPVKISCNYSQLGINPDLTDIKIGSIKYSTYQQLFDYLSQKTNNQVWIIGILNILNIKIRNSLPHLNFLTIEPHYVEECMVKWFKVDNINHQIFLINFDSILKLIAENVTEVKVENWMDIYFNYLRELFKTNYEDKAHFIPGKSKGIKKFIWMNIKSDGDDGVICHTFKYYKNKPLETK